jgi:hypothetical protein
MKRVIIFIFGFILILLYSCSKEMIEPDQSGDLKDLTCGKYGPNKPHGHVFTVTPSENATQALIDAFEAAKAAGRGSVVQLEAGTYTTGMIEVRDFDGYFRGAGRGKTIITNLPDLLCEAVWEDNLLPSIFTFIGGNVTMTNMTIHLQDGQPCVPGPINDSQYGDLCCALVLSDWSYNYVPDHKYIKAVVDNIDFIPGNDGGYGTSGTIGNVGMILFCGMDKAFFEGNEVLSTGDFSITNCYFENGVTGPDFFGLDENSFVNIENNTVVGCIQQIFIGDCLGSKFIIKNNKLRAGSYTDLFVCEYESYYCDYNYFCDLIPKKSSSYFITGNDIQSPPGVISLFIKDYWRTVYPEETFPQQIAILNNTFKTEDGGIGIQSINNIDAKIWNNKFLGTGSTGILVQGDEPTGTYAENLKIMNNNFMKADYTDAAVYLEPYTRNCTVVGVPSDLIVDMGVNNKIIGVKAHKHGPHYMPGKNPHFKSMPEHMMRMRLPGTL